MSYLFYGCSSLKILPNISNWNTGNVINMSYMFCGVPLFSDLSNIAINFGIDKDTMMKLLKISIHHFLLILVF